MISGAEGPGRTDSRGASRYGPMTTGSFRLMSDNELGSPDGIRPGTVVSRGEGVERALGKAQFVSKFAAARKVLQKRLLARGMTPYFPEGLAGPLADPILGSHRGTEEGWKVRKHVDIEAIDMNALAKKAGSRLMLAAFAETLGDASLDNRYIPVNAYTGYVADAFMADPKTTVLWHMLGSNYNPYTPEMAVRSGVTQLVSAVKGARLLKLGRSTKWHVDGLGDLLGSSEATSFDLSLLAALNGLHEQEQFPTLIKVLNTGANAFKNGVDKPSSGNNGGGSGGVVAGMMEHTDSDGFPIALKIRFRQITDMSGMLRPLTSFITQPTLVKVGV